MLLVRERLKKTIELWYITEPLFFAVWTTHRLVINTSIKTIRVGEGKIEYNPEFIETLDDATLEAVLKFEVMRIILKHPYSRRKEIETLAYLASNITVQEYLKTVLPFPDAKTFFGCHDYDLKHFEFYYNQLLQEDQAKPNPSGFKDETAGSSFENKNDTADPDSGNDQANSSTTGKPSESSNKESHDEEKGSMASSFQEPTSIEDYIKATEALQTENTQTWGENEYFQQQVNEKIEQAQENAANSWGSIPGKIQALILATLKPKMNYRLMLKAFRARILSNKRRLTRMKPSRRYGFLYMGSRRDFATRLLFAVDVSGSVSNTDIAKAFSVINQLFKYGIEQLDVIQFDTEVKGVMDFKKARYKVEVIGRGGTDFQPVIDYIDVHRDYDGLIIFTDGYAPCPSAPKSRRTRLFWLFNHEKNYNAAKSTLKALGRASFIQED